MSEAQAAKWTPARASSSAWYMSTIRCLTDWNVGDGTVEDHPDLGVLDGLFEGPVGHPDQLGGQADRDVVEHPTPQAGLVPGGPEGLDRLLVEDQSGELPGRVEARDRLGLGRGSRNERKPSSASATTMTQSAV